MNLIELREKGLEVWNKAKAFLDSHRKDGVLSAEDDAAYSRMEKELDDLGKEIIRQEKLDAYEKEMAKNLAEPLIGKPGGTPSEKTGRASDAYKNAMLDAMRCNFKRVSNILQEGVDSDGGYLVPEEYDSRIIDILNEEKKKNIDELCEELRSEVFYISDRMSWDRLIRTHWIWQRIMYRKMVAEDSQ